MFRHFDLYVLVHWEYLLFFYHAAVIRGAFWGVNSHSKGLLLFGPAGQENTAKLHDIIIIIIIINNIISCQSCVLLYFCPS